MTKDELIKIGYQPRLCKIGTLYFKGGFFCILTDNGKVDVRHNTDDMTSLGLAFTEKEIKELEKSYYIKLRDKLQQDIRLLDIIIENY